MKVIVSYGDLIAIGGLFGIDDDLDVKVQSARQCSVNSVYQTAVGQEILKG